MHVPGKEVLLVNDQNFRHYLFRSPMNLDRAREEVLSLADVLRSEGVRVNLVEGLEDRPNAMYARDPFLMTPKGAVVSRFMYEVRRGEERAYMDAIKRLGYPVVKVMSEPEVFEGGNAMILGPGVALAGVGERTNREGLEALRKVLREAGVDEVIEVQTPMSSIHIDEYTAQVDVKTIVTVRQVFPWEAADRLRRAGFNVLAVEYSQLPGGIGGRLCLNLVTVKPQRVVMGSGCEAVRKLLESEGVDVIELDVDEVLRGGGGIHCLTGVLAREPVRDS
ncbi:MAG: dimethylarginine dimethylaminohydrolase family protein [Acidilobus sp.]